MAKDPMKRRGAGHEDDILGDAFEAAQQDVRPLSPDLEARILMQAAQAQAGFAREREANGLFARLQRAWGELGGWPVAAGLATATVAGLWLGVSSPPALDAVWSGVGLTSASLDGDFPDYEAFFEEI